MKRVWMFLVKNFRSTLVSGVLFLFVSCGVEVGNPTKPIAAPSADDQEALALVSSEQLEETVAASSESQGSSSNFLALTRINALPLLSNSCTVGSDGTVTYQRDTSDSSTVDLPKNNAKKRVEASSTRVSTALLKSSDSGLSCGPAGRFPSFDWQNLSLFQSEISSKRVTEKTIKLLPDDVLDQSVHVEAEGSRQVTWRRVSYASDSVSFTKTMSFRTALNRTTTKAGVASTYSSTVESIKDLVVNQSNAALKVQSFMIESGSVMSDYKSDQKLILTYDRLEFIKGTSCYPQSGKLSAAIYANADLVNPTLSYDIVFDQGEASLIFSDGTVKELLLTDCDIKGS